MNVPVHFAPRDYQLETLENIRDKWLVVLEWARRAGKGLFCWIYAILRMVEEPIGVIIIYLSLILIWIGVLKALIWILCLILIRAWNLIALTNVLRFILITLILI